MDSLIVCLRARNPETDPDCHEAAAAIERLSAALRRIIEADPYMPDDLDEETYERNRRANQMAQIARIALSGRSAPNQYEGQS